MKIAQVYINQLNINTDRPFDYFVPEKLENEIMPGMRVIVPFGINNKKIDGLIYKITEGNNTEKLKKILGTIDGFPTLDWRQLEICEWLQFNYHSFFMDAANSYYPGTISIKTRRHKSGETEYYVNSKAKEDISYRFTEKFQEMDFEKLSDLLKSNAIIQKRILRLIFEKKQKHEWIKSEINNCNTALKALIKANIIEPYKSENDRSSNFNLSEKPALTIIQKKILEEYEKSDHKGYLIHGVTGSGKTEVYLRMMEASLKTGKSCLYLVPEISLTPQTINRIRERFDEEIAVIHSKITESDRIRQYRDIENRKIKIIIGARSAIFSPFKNLGVIIIDEEHENTYKSGNRPRFDTITLAGKIAELHGAKLVLGSATPSIATYYNAIMGKYKLFKMPDRINGQSMPPSTIVDMREELKNGNRSFLSKRLYDSIKRRLEEKEQVILFLNKRGYFSFVFCRECGHVIKCNKCDVAMTYHGKSNKMECHYCKSSKPVAEFCPNCNSKKIKYSGSGTERIQSMLAKYFPESKILRMDTDTMRKKDDVQNALTSFSKGEADILLGTQMITKGFDFENVTLVGVLLADLTLNFPDFRASERTFQLITQVSGRAGRGERQGEIVIQTYDPEHYVLEFASRHDYEGFYEKEIKYRKIGDYPPFTQLLYVGFSGNQRDAVKKDCETYYKMLEEEIKDLGDQDMMNQVYPPAQSNITRINNKYRYYILIKTNEIKTFNKVISKINRSRTNKIKSNMVVDVNPNIIY
ncbi:replication restart helicase PriA [Alkalibacter mobilis]|uniref:replication restart helicase PriA n=1 Tax=Alkalibacter mobilis TaxID=2787712 RepID=UPI00189E4D9B|nr:primosomal protein N' [Alkalibacter mobilis]